MADLLAQFDIVERAEQARDRRGDGGVGGGRPRGAALNPFDEDLEPDFQPPPMQVRSVC